MGSDERQIKDAYGAIGGPGIRRGHPSCRSPQACDDLLMSSPGPEVMSN